MKRGDDGNYLGRSHASVTLPVMSVSLLKDCIEVVSVDLF